MEEVRKSVKISNVRPRFKAKGCGRGGTTTSADWDARGIHLHDGDYTWRVFDIYINKTYAFQSSVNIKLK